MAETCGISRVNVTCQWCHGVFTYEPGLLAPDLGVRITVERVGDECVRHSARVVDINPEESR